MTPIILFEYFNDINRTKRRCQQKDLQSLYLVIFIKMIVNKNEENGDGVKCKEEG